MPQPIILIGASVRAAAQSAVRGGLMPWCSDLFADRDLRTIAPVQRVRDYPAGLLDALDDAPSAPLAYTGALENFPDLIDTLARRCPVWGNSANVLRAVRDPLVVADALRTSGLPVPEVQMAVADVPDDGSWLRKPLRSGGGWHIQTWDKATRNADRHLPAVSTLARTSRRSGGFYFQRRVDGLECSAVYVSARGTSRLLGITRQLVGTNWTGASAFHYAGSIGPLPVAAAETSAFEKLGACLAARFQLVGLFGVDAIVNDQGVWPLEVNPRYPASAEILEQTLGFSAMRLHADACAQGRLTAAPSLDASRMAGKAIVVALAPCPMPEQAVEWAEDQNTEKLWPSVADIPDAGTKLRPGSPVMTVFAEGDELFQIEADLKQRVAEVHRLLTQP